eukprot:gene14331-biopygen605
MGLPYFPLPLISAKLSLPPVALAAKLAALMPLAAKRCRLAAWRHSGMAAKRGGMAAKLAALMPLAASMPLAQPWDVQPSKKTYSPCAGWQTWGRPMAALAAQRRQSVAPWRQSWRHQCFWRQSVAARRHGGKDNALAAKQAMIQSVQPIQSVSVQFQFQLLQARDARATVARWRHSWRQSWRQSWRHSGKALAAKQGRAAAKRGGVAAKRRGMAAWRHGGKAWRHGGKAWRHGGKAWRHGGMTAWRQSVAAWRQSVAARRQSWRHQYLRRQSVAAWRHGG